MKRVLACAAAAVVVVSGCTRSVEGLATLPMAEPGGAFLHAGDVLLGQAQMRAVTDSAGLTTVPGTDSSAPVDITDLAAAVPAACAFTFADTLTFGTDWRDFRKVFYQIPPDSAMISEAAAAYPGTDTARGAFATLRSTVMECAATSYGPLLIGEWQADAGSLRMRVGECGRDYRVKSTMLVEVTFCGFDDPTATLVVSDILSRITPQR